MCWGLFLEEAICFVNSHIKRPLNLRILGGRLREVFTVVTMFILLLLGKMREVQRFLSRICAHKVKRVLRWN